MNEPTALPGEVARPDTKRRGRRFTGRGFWVVQLLTYAGLLATWELLARAGAIDTFFFPEPSRIGGALWRLTASGDIFAEASITFLEMAVGLVIGSVAGIGLGLALVRMPLAWRLVQPLVYFAYSLPRIALAPLFIVALGLGIASKIATVVFTVFFVLLINTVAGAESVSHDYVRSARALGATEGQVTRKVIIPGTLAWIFSGLRLAVSLAFLSAVVAEFVGATGGLGYRLQLAAVYFNTVEIFAWLFVLGFFAALINVAVTAVERRLLAWRPKTYGM
ncbi:ABC transporter permease [Microbacterium sp.]|uniref:ABC transporter permease n=1 Tax=Microbacterium sp. TaxID=51671 RepID=UPI0031FE597A|nr:ABC transporter permease [Microbacterium sp.]